MQQPEISIHPLIGRLLSKVHVQYTKHFKHRLCRIGEKSYKKRSSATFLLMSQNLLGFSD